MKRHVSVQVDCPMPGLWMLLPPSLCRSSCPCSSLSCVSTPPRTRRLRWVDYTLNTPQHMSYTTHTLHNTYSTQHTNYTSTVTHIECNRLHVQAAKAYTFIYAIIMTAVVVGTVQQIVEDISDGVDRQSSVLVNDSDSSTTTTTTQSPNQRRSLHQ